MSSSIEANVTKIIDSASRAKDNHDCEKSNSPTTIAIEKIPNNNSLTQLIIPSDIQPTIKEKNPSNKRWTVLASFSLLSFSNAVLWITFGPCLFIFMDHYKQSTPSYINSLATIYMIVYPILLLPILQIFDRWGLRKGILVGAFLNALGTFIRFLGSFGPSGFWLLFIGQTIAAISGVFVLGVPPKLANTWFESGEQNLATGIGVTANSAGVAAGFLLSPWFINEATAAKDIPTYLLIQFGACSLIYLICVYTFTCESKAPRSHIVKSSTCSTIKAFCTDKMFMLLVTSYGLTVGASYAVSTLLAQIVIPVFKMHDETQVGYLGFLSVIAGMVGSVLIGLYLDRTFAYKQSCRILYIATILSLALFTISLKIESMALVFVSCILFGFSSFAITPAVFQYAPIITSRLGEDENVSTGILNSSAQISGIILVVLMDITENVDQEFTMELSCWLLLAIVFMSIILIWLVKEENVKEQEFQKLMNNI